MVGKKPVENNNLYTHPNYENYCTGYLNYLNSPL